jgi:YidC/Oxa1 family membrane protein insertase
VNRNLVLLVVSLLALFSAYFYMNYRVSHSESPGAGVNGAVTSGQSSATQPADANGQPNLDSSRVSTVPEVKLSTIVSATATNDSAASAASPSTANAPTSASGPNVAQSSPGAVGPSLASGPSSAQAAPTALTVSAPQTSDARPALVDLAKEQDLSFKIPAAQVRFSKDGGCIGDMQLTNYKQELSKPEAAALFENFSLCKAFGFKWGEQDLRKSPFSMERLGEQSVRITQRVDYVDIVRTWDFNFKDYMSQLKIEVKNYGQKPVQSTLAFELGGTSEHVKAGGMFSNHAIEYRQFLYADADKVHRTHLKFESSPKPEQLVNLMRTNATWFGTDSIYFLTALLPMHREAMDFNVQKTGFNIQRIAGSEDVRTVVEAWASVPVQLSASASKTYEYKVYMGPKQRALLQTVGDVKLEEAIDYGFFRVVALPMYKIMEWLFHLLGNWGLAIIALTLAIKVLFFPLMIKAFVSGKKMQKMQPMMTELREKYKDDKAKQQQETMALMSQHGVNPVSGCLPILPQIPVFFGLNSVLTHTFELRHAPFYGWIHDLSFHDPIFVSPVLMAILMFIQQKMTPMPSMEPAQQKMMQFMPLLFAGFMLTYPSGLVVYIITNSLVSLSQQQYMMKKYKDL